MRNVEKTVKNLDRAHKIRVRRRFADPRSRRHGLQTTSKIHRKIKGKLEGKKDRKTGRKSRLGTPQKPPKIESKLQKFVKFRSKKPFGTKMRKNNAKKTTNMQTINEKVAPDRSQPRSGPLPLGAGSGLHQPGGPLKASF